MDGLRLILLIVGLLFIAGIYLHGTRWGRKDASEGAGDDPEQAHQPESYLDTLDTSRERASRERGVPQWDFIAETDFESLRAAHVADDSDVESLLDDFRAPAGGTDEEADSSLESLDFIVPDAPSAREVEAGMRGLGLLAPSRGADDERAGEEIVVALSVMVKEDAQRLSGQRVVSALEAVGFRYGDMQIFHYPDPHRSEPEQAWFSAANVLNPGTFDLDEIDAIATPGLALFMCTHGEDDAIEAFDTMLETGHSLADALEAELLDETRNRLTRQSVNHLRERIVESVRRRKLG